MNTLHRNSRILIVDDDEDDFLITSDYIRSIPGNSFVIDWAGTYKQGITQLAANNYDLYFVDYRLGAKSGVDFLREANDMHCESPIVLLTGQGSYSIDIEAMKLGAVDYLIKGDLNTEKTERCIRYALERADTLKALRRSETKFRSIFEKSKDIVFITDSILCITDVNDAILVLLGYEVPEAYGMRLTDLILKEEDRQYLLDAVRNATAINDYPMYMVAKNGGRVQCTITLSVENTGTNEVYIQGIIHDITNLKKAETAALQTEKLAATGRLVRTLAHEVRNPLNNISMSAEQLLAGVQEDEESLYLDIIKRNSLRINNLIGELLQSANPKDKAHKPHPLHKITEEVIAASADRLTLKKIGSDIRYPAADIIIMADSDNLKLALLNIVINAIEAMEENTGMLTMSLQRKNKIAVLTIADNGCGISEENITKIFEPYYTRKRDGAGLGLSFTLSILKAHNAAIDVTSDLGKGTVFTVTFPAVAH